MSSDHAELPNLEANKKLKLTHAIHSLIHCLNNMLIYFAH